jgi:secondary thiamine-phosphate synthase enzyme
MAARQYFINLSSFPRGFHIIDTYIWDAVKQWPETGVCHLFIQHTSAALSINEGASPDVRWDMERIFNAIVPESKSYEHNDEGMDDMPAHAKAVLAGSSLSIPITNGKLNLGTWQSIWLCEFRNHGGERKIVVTIID